MKKYAFIFALALIAAIAPNDALALNTTIGGRVCYITQAMTGNIGRGIATLGVVFLGIGAFFGKVNWGLAIMVAIGIAGIFGASAIMNTFSGSTACSNTTV